MVRNRNRNRYRYRYLAPRLLTLTLIVALLAAAADHGSFRSSAVSAQDEATPEAAAPTGGVDITLTSPDGSPLAGACFAVTDAAGVTLTGCDEDGDGVTRIDGLAAGTAAVVETTFPAGYTGTPDGTVEIVPGDFASIGFTNALIATPEPTPSPTVEPSPTAPQSPADELQSTVQQESVTGQLAVTTVFDQGGSVTRTCFKVYADAGGGERGPLVAAHCDQDDGQADGRLLFDGLDTQSYILVQTSAPASVARAADTPFTIMAGQTTALTIQEHPAGTLAVTTINDAGQGLPGACYRAYLATASGTRGAYVGSGCDGTNADGVALVRSLPFGDYVLGQSTPPSGYTAAPDRPFSITNQSETPITVRQSLPGVLAITTVDPDLNASVAGACFRIYEDAGDGVRGSRIASGCDGDDGSADGARSFAGLTAGPYVLTELSAPSGFAPALNQTFAITSNQTTTITVQNRRASALSIAAVDDQQHAVPGDCLKVYTDNGKGKRGTFVTSGCDGDDGAADGTTHIATLAPNAYVLVDFTPPAGYAAAADQPFTIVAGQPAALTIQHRAGGEATISLLDPAGRPLPGACFSADLQQSGTTVARRCDKDDGTGDGKTTF
ncbi:MAG TPA: SpaA isopeptide-forming pilin-related protein, partial [Thermomicrobiales bacterium]|nr:SpaA isopeptide-forming pilin-related protein [Thermomicrobiales bacterium]